MFFKKSKWVLFLCQGHNELTRNLPEIYQKGSLITFCNYVCIISKIRGKVTVTYLPRNIEMILMFPILDLLRKSIFDHKGTKSQRHEEKNFVVLWFTGLYLCKRSILSNFKRSKIYIYSIHRFYSDSKKK